MENSVKKVALVTGAGRGIGAACAAALVKAGYTVYGGARSAFSLPGVTSLVLDVTDDASVKAAIEAVRLGEGRLDLLVNNAGMGISGPAEHTAPAAAAAQFEVNFFGAFRMTQAALPLLRACRGTVINISSAASTLCIPYQSFYSASKAALDAFSYALRAELRPFGVRVCCVMPGDTKTAFTAARNKSPDDGIYADRARASVARMERDEQKGMPPEKTARAVLRAARRKNPPPAITVGFSYKLLTLLGKLLPKRLVQWVIFKMYG